MRRIALLIGIIAVAGIIASLMRSADATEPQPKVEASPLAAYLGFGYHADREDAIAKQAEIDQEAFVGECMGAAGFQYLPETPRESRNGVVSGDERASSQNDAYRDSLDEQKLAEYKVALYGHVPAADQSMGDAGKFDTNGDGRISLGERAGMGCRGAASAKFPGTEAVRSALAPQLGAMEEAIASSSEVADGRAAWAKCMNALGYEGDTAEEVQHSELSAAADGQLTHGTYKSVEPCNDHVRAGFAKARVREEQRFFEQYKDTIEELALRP